MDRTYKQITESLTKKALRNLEKSGHINELSVAMLNAAAERAEEVGNLYLANKYANLRDERIAKFNEDGEETKFVFLGSIPVKLSCATKSRKSFDTVYDFLIYKYYPTETTIMACISKKSHGNVCAAVILNPFNKVNQITDQTMTNDLLKELGCVSMIKKNNFRWMMDIIQAKSRDPETNEPLEPDYQLARKFVRKIYELTSMKFNANTFAQTRNKYVIRETRKEDYVYIGGFNITNDIKVRICRFIGVAQSDYRKYCIYVKVFNLGFMLDVYYRMLSIIVKGGLKSGTAYQMLIEKGYLDKTSDPQIVKSTVYSNMLNIYPIMKALKDKEYEFDNGDEVNLCDLILTNISRIIAEKEQLTKNTLISRNDVNTQVIDLEMFEPNFKYEQERLAALQQQHTGATIEDVGDTEDGEASEDDDFGM